MVSETKQETQEIIQKKKKRKNVSNNSKKDNNSVILDNEVNLQSIECLMKP